MGILRKTYLFTALAFSLLVTVAADCKKPDNREAVEITEDTKAVPAAPAGNNAPGTGEAPKIAAGDFVFVEKGRAKVPVILYADAPPRTVAAAKEFIEYIRKVSGATPELIIGEPKVMPKSAVWLGYQPQLKKLFSDIDFNLKEEEVIIAANGSHMAILGRDKWERNTAVQFGRFKLPDWQKEYGTVNAIYTFLQEYLEVRWFMPGDLGEDIIKKQDISFRPFVYRYAPQIKARANLFITMTPGRDSKEGPSEEWSIRNRLYYSSFYINGGHPFIDWWSKYGKSHPEIFALTTEGARKPMDKPNYVKLCVSNTAIDALWLKEVEAQLKQDPYQTIFNVNENDGYGSGYCTCPNCRALDAKDMFDKEPNFSDRHLHFANRLGAALQKKYPGKGYKVTYFAYGPDRPKPLREKPTGSVVITSVSNFHLRRKTPIDVSQKSVKEYADWSSLSDQMVWRPNLGSPVGLQWGMPDVAPNQAFEDFRFVADRHVEGLYFDSFHEHWATQAPQYYITARLAWNPRLDKESVLDDYYNRFYGPAAASMRSYWELMEETRQKHFMSRKMSNYARLWVGETYTADWFRKANSLLSQAMGKASGKYRERVALAKQGLDFTELIVGIREEMESAENKKAKPGGKVDQLWDKVYALKKQMSPLAINFQFVKTRKESNKDKSNKRMIGLEADAPVTPAVLKKIEKEDADKE